MKKYFKLLLIAIICSILIIPNNTNATTLKEYEDLVAKYTKELQEKEAKIAKGKEEIEQVKRNIASIENQIDETQKEIERLRGTSTH